MKLSRAHLPPTIVALIEVIGLPATLALVRHYGGVSFWPCRHGAGRAELNALIGVEAAEKLTATYREEIHLPKCAEASLVVLHTELRAEFDAQTGAGLSARRSVLTLARKYRYTDRHVWRVLKRADEGGEVVEAQAALNFEF